MAQDSTARACAHAQIPMHIPYTYENFRSCSYRCCCTCRKIIIKKVYTCSMVPDVKSIREYQNFPNSYLLFTKVSMHLSISHSLCSAVHNYDSLCRRSSRSPIMLSIFLVGRAGASPPRRTAAIIFLYIYLFIYIYVYIFISVSYVVP